MTDISRVLRAGAWRVGASTFLHALVVSLTLGVGVALLLRLGEQLLGIRVVWERVVYGLVGVSVLWSVVWAVAFRPSASSVARRVDEGGNLRESLSTALSLGTRTDAWARVTVESATRQARGVRLSSALPITGPKHWYAPLAAGLVLAIVFLVVPKGDVLGLRSARRATDDDRVQVITAKQEVDKAKEKVEEMAKQLGLEPKVPEASGGDKPEPMKPEEIRREALKDLTKLQDRLEQITGGPKSQQLDAMRQQLKQVSNPGEQSNDLSKALAAGNFGQAKAEVLKLAAQAKSGGLSKEQQAQAAKQLDSIAKQLDKAAKDKKDLENTLQKAGLDKNLAGDPAAAQKAIENDPNLSKEQKDQLSKAAQSQAETQQAAKGMSDAMSTMSQAMSPQKSGASGEGGKSGEMSQAASQLAQQMDQLDQMSKEMQLAQAALGECKSAMGSIAGQCEGGSEGLGGAQNTGAFRTGSSQSEGNGRGGPGLGKGGNSGSAKADFDTTIKKAIGAQGPGPIVSSRMVEGESIKGESKAAFVEALAKGEQNATEAIENNAVPREFHESIKSYFGRLRQKVTAPSTPAAPAEDDKTPVEPAKDAGKK